MSDKFDFCLGWIDKCIASGCCDRAADSDESSALLPQKSCYCGSMH